MPSRQLVPLTTLSPGSVLSQYHFRPGIIKKNKLRTQHQQECWQNYTDQSLLAGQAFQPHKFASTSSLASCQEQPAHWCSLLKIRMTSWIYNHVQKSKRYRSNQPRFAIRRFQQESFSLRLLYNRSTIGLSMSSCIRKIYPAINWMDAVSDLKSVLNRVSFRNTLKALHNNQRRGPQHRPDPLLWHFVLKNPPTHPENLRFSSDLSCCNKCSVNKQGYTL